MAAPKVSAPLTAWLSARRDELNARFKAAKRRFPRLDAQNALELVASYLDPLAGDGADGAGDLLSEVFDLILLHAGRGLLNENSPLQSLLRDTFPKLRAQLLLRPKLLPASLSNAVENLEGKGMEFLAKLDALIRMLQTPEQVLDAGVILAWQLGEARLREKALNRASQLPNAVTLGALGLSDWPPAAAPLAVASLMGDGWSPPRERIKRQTLDNLSAMPREKILELLQTLVTPEPMPPAAWRAAGTIGEFAGFGGQFVKLPQLLYAGSKPGRHLFWVRCGDDNFRIDADQFGWVCKPDPAAGFPLNEPLQNGSVKAKAFAKKEDGIALYSSGEVAVGGKSCAFDSCENASGFHAAPDFIAVSQPNSFRLRIYRAGRTAL